MKSDGEADPSDLWLSYLNGLIQSSSQPLTLDAFVGILEMFDRAEGDYHCERIGRAHAYA